MSKIIKWNGYLIGEAFGGTALALLIASAFGVNVKPKTIAKFTITAGIVWGAQAYFGCASLTNKTNRRIYCKHEDNDDLITCEPGETVYNIDGFAFDGKVYKLSDGVQATLKEDGDINYNSLTGLMFNGFKNKTIDERLPGWGTLFDVKDL